MKKNLAKILVLVLIVSLLIPAAVSAVGTTYVVSMTLTDGSATITASPSSYVADTATLSELYASFGDLRAKAEEKFAGNGKGAELDAALAAFTGNDDAAWAAVVDGVTLNPASAADVLKDRSKTVGDLAALASSIVATKDGFTLTLALNPYVAPAPSTPPEPQPTETPAEDNTAVVTAEDIAAAGDEPIELEIEDVEAAEDAADADEITIDIPEDAEDVKVLIPVADVNENTVVILVKADGTEEILPKAAMTENGLVVVVDEDVTVKIVENEVSYTDIASCSAEEQAAIAFVSARELFQGIDIGVFAPETTMDRFMFATVLYRLESKPDTAADISFDDVADGKWYSDGVAWAAENGIVVGYSDSDFGGADPVTREQIALMLWRYVGKPAADAVETSAHAWAADAMSWAVANGLFAADVDAQGEASRVDVAVVLKAFINLNQGEDMVADAE